jgi:signal peptidase I
MGLLIFFLVFYLLTCFGLSLLFPKAGVPASKAWIPGVNFIEWCKIIGKKPIEALWLLVPIVNIFTFSGMAVDLVRSFGKYSMLDSLSAVLFTPLKFFLVSRDGSKYVGPTLTLEEEYAANIKNAEDAKDKYKLSQLEAANPYKKSGTREWVESLFFAVFAAAFIRMFLIEAYVIPTPSMEGSLNVGDYLFVSKAHYGIRMPMTVAMVPLLHNQIPFINKESYLTKPSFDYTRLPGFEKVEAGKPFVFNWPVGDSVYVTKSRPYAVGYVEPYILQQDLELARLVEKKDFVVRPVDKRDHYIKRCVAGPGDSLKIVNKQLYVNGVAAKNPKEMQFCYDISVPPTASVVALSPKNLEKWGIDFGDAYGNSPMPTPGRMCRFFLTQSQVEKLKTIDPAMRVEHFAGNDSGSLFPRNSINSKGWTVDNFGPIYIPKAGATVALTIESLPFYRRAISVYENNSLEVKGQDIYVNGTKTDKYTFKQNYYWAMGDNRHNSEDSRSWGYVPEDHIVGKPLFIWFSTKEGSMRNGINWDRIFTSANKD